MAKLEFFDGTNWIQLGGGTGTVTSVGITGSTGLSVSGSPITTSGTINLTLGLELQALSAFASTGLMARTASNTYTARTITASTGISISNGSGVSGNPTVSVFNIPINTLSGYPGINTSVLFGNGTWNDLTLTGAVEGYIVSGGIISTSLNQTQSFFGAVNFNWNLTNNASLKFNTYGGDDFNLVIGNNNYNWNVTTNCNNYNPYFKISFLNTTYPPTPSWIINSTPFAIYADNIDIQKLMLYIDANIDINFNKIRNLATPVNNYDGVNKLYADSLITAQLSALSNLSTTGIMVRTSANSFATRTLTAGNGISIANGDGVSGNPIISATQNNLYIVGEYKFIAGNTTPSGFLLCDGSSISRTTYAALFAVIGTAFGSSSGTTFNLPDLRGRVLSAVNVSNPIGTYAGADSRALTLAQMPQHNHTGSLSSDVAYNAPNNCRYVGSSSGFNGWLGGYLGPENSGDNNLIGATRRNGMPSYDRFDILSTHSHTVTINNSGSSSAVDMRQLTCYGGNYYIFTGV